MCIHNARVPETIPGTQTYWKVLEHVSRHGCTWIRTPYFYAVIKPPVDGMMPAPAPQGTGPDYQGWHLYMDRAAAEETRVKGAVDGTFDVIVPVEVQGEDVLFEGTDDQGLACVVVRGFRLMPETLDAAVASRKQELGIK